MAPPTPGLFVASVTRCGGRDRIGRYAARAKATPNPSSVARDPAEGPIIGKGLELRPKS